MPTRSFLEAFHEQVRSRPDAYALSDAAGAVTYRELAHRVESAREQLTALDLDPQVPVCVRPVKSVATVALLIATLGHRRVLLPPLSLGAEALSRVCALVGCGHLLTATDQGLRVEGSGVAGIARPGDGFFLTTSGTTGTPKVVDLDPEGIDAFLRWSGDTFAIGPDTRVFSYAPLNFDLSLLDVWSPLARGAEVQLVGEEEAADGRRLAARCRERTPTVVQGVPLLFRLLTERGEAYPGVRDVLLTGDAVPAPLLDRIVRAFPDARFWNVYGCTETNDSYLHRVDPDDLHRYGTMPIGREIPGVRARIVDMDGRDVSGPGSGELVVRTPFQARGYLDDPTAPGAWRDGWFHTGDRVRRDEDGLLFLEGRTDFQVKVRGVRTNLQAVEQVILAHPDVVEAVVLAIADPEAGAVLRAVVRLRPGADTNGLHLRLHCVAELPRTAVPGAFDLVDEPMPRTSTGKMNRKALLARIAATEAPAPASAGGPAAAPVGVRS